MSVGYADLLAPRADVGGTLGGPELHDGARSVLEKMARLAAMIREAKAAIDAGTPLELPAAAPQPKNTKTNNNKRPPPQHENGAAAPAPQLAWDPTRPHASPLVVFTGAGLSTSCGIPDFRGPSGVWTRRSQGLPPLAAEGAVPFSRARPSFAHMALVRLHSEALCSLVVSQNVDGLHLRSGLPRAALAELHGDCFAERCGHCGGEHVRDFETSSVGFKPTGRRCAHPSLPPPRSASASASANKGKAKGGGGARGRGGGGSGGGGGGGGGGALMPVPACFVATGNPPGTELLGAAPLPHHHHFSSHDDDDHDDDHDGDADDEEEEEDEAEAGKGSPPPKQQRQRRRRPSLGGRCNGPLHDQCLDWDDALPPQELRLSERRASAAAVALCLGTSLQIRPAADLPLRAPRAGGALAIVNLQRTPKDGRAALVLRARCDEAAAALLDALGLEAPDYARHDRLSASHASAWEKGNEEEGQEEGGGGGGGASSWGFELSIGSVHGPGLPLPVTVRRVEVFFEGEEGARGGGSGQRRRGEAGPSSAAFDLPAERTPLVVRRSGLADSGRPLTAVLRLALEEDDDNEGGGGGGGGRENGKRGGSGRAAAADGGRLIELRYTTAPPPRGLPSRAPPRCAATLTFETQRVAYAARQREIVRDLRRRAAAEEQGEQGEQEGAAEQQQRRRRAPLRRLRAPAERAQRYGEREAAAVEEEEDGEEQDDDGDDDDDFVPSRAAAAAAAAAAANGGGAARRSGGRASSRPRKAAKLLDV